MWTVLSLLAPKRRALPARRRGFRPQMEALEERWCPTGGVFEWADPTGGALDPTFGSGGQVVTSFSNNYDTPQAITVQPDGKIVVVGGTETSGSRTGFDFLVARYNANGTLDASFGSGGHTATAMSKANDGAKAVALQPQASGPAKILAAGSVDGSDIHVGLARYNANGTLDTTFGSKGEVTTYVGGYAARAMAVDSSGRILVATGATLLRYTPNGALDTSFGNRGQVATGIPPAAAPESIAFQADGKIVCASQETIPGTGQGEFILTRITANGAVDTTFGSGGTVVTHVGNSDNFNAMTVQADGKVVVAGGESGLDPDGVDRQGTYLLRYNADGSPDATFGAGGVAYLVKPGLFFGTGVGGVSVQSDGWIVAGGPYSDGGSQGYFGVLRVSPSGALDPGYGTGGWALVTGGEANAMALEPDGRVILAGLTSFSGIREVALARFLPSAPQIGSFTASADMVTAGSGVTLTASNITDENSGSSVAQVAFYVMVSGSPVLLGHGTQNSDGSWSCAFDTTGYASGTYTLYAQATDNFGALGNPVALTLTVQ